MIYLFEETHLLSHFRIVQATGRLKTLHRLVLTSCRIILTQLTRWPNSVTLAA
jgi:hypothetical protein